MLIFGLFSVAYGFETEGVSVSVIGGSHYFGEPVHQDITREGLYFLNSGPLETIVGQHVIIEEDQSSPNHFDNCQFSETIDRINARYDVAVSAFNPVNPQPTLAAEKFGLILHAVQDFYAHSNWVEMKRTDLVDPWFEHWRQLGAYNDSSHDRAVFVLEEDGSTHVDFTISTRNKKPTISHESWDALGNGRKMGLISGTFDADVNKCPANASIPHGGKLINRFNRTPESSDFPDELNKDNPAIKGHAAARILAVQQTTHEFCRLVELTRQAYGQRGVDIIYDNWVQGQYQIDSPFNNARCAPQTGISAISDTTHATVENNDKIAKTQKLKTGVIGDKKLVTKISNSEIKITKDEIKTIYKIAKLHESAATSLTNVNDQQKIILQKATNTMNKGLSKENKDSLKSLLKEQDSDKKDIKFIQDSAKKITKEIKKIAQKQGVKTAELDKIVKTQSKSGKSSKQGPIDQLKQDSTDAKNSLDEAAKLKDQTDLARIAIQIGNILPDSEGRSDFEKRMEKQFEEQQAREAMHREREAVEKQKQEQARQEQERVRQEQEAEEKSKQNVLDLMQGVLDILQREQQAQTDSILNTIQEPTLRDLFTPSSTTRDKIIQDKATPKESLVKPDGSKKIERTGDSDEEVIIKAYSVATMLSSTMNKPSDVDMLKRVKTQLTQQEYHILVDFLDSRIGEKIDSVPSPLKNPAPITDGERAKTLAELSSAAVIPPTFFDEQKSQKPSNEKNKPDFEILLKPNSMRLPRGGYGEVDVTVKSLNGWNDKVWLNIPIPIGPIHYPTIVPNIVSPTSGANAEAAFAVDVSLFSCPGKYRMAVYGMTHDQMPMEISYTYFNLEIIDPGKIFELSTDQKPITIPKGSSKSFSLVVKNLDNQDHAYLIDTNKFKAPSGVTIEHKNTIGSTSPEQTNKGTITIKTSNNIKTPLTFTLPLRAQTSLNCDPTPTENTSVIVNIVGDSSDSPSEQILVPSSQPKLEQTKSNTKPTLSLPKQVTQEATGPAGANVAFSTSSQDKEDGSLTPVCSPASGTTFPIGATPVSCVVTDSNNNSVSGTFTVTVRDTTPPAFGPFQPTEGVKDDTGVQVFFDVTATDLVDGSTQVSCNYQSGYKFPPGVTDLKCTTSDSRGNQSTKTVQITVTVTESGQ